MRKNKKIMRLVSKVLFICLIVNTLPASFSVHAKTLTPRELAALRAEVNHKIGKIKREINVLNVVKFAVPSIVLVGGAALTIVGTALTAWLFKKYRKKLAKDFNKLMTKFTKKTSNYTQMINRATKNKELIHNQIYSIKERKSIIGGLKAIWEKIRKKKLPPQDKQTSFYENLEKAGYIDIMGIPEKFTKAFKTGKEKTTKIIENLNQYLENLASKKNVLPGLEEDLLKKANEIEELNNLLNSYIKTKPTKTSKTILTASTVIVPILTALSGFIVTGLLSGLAFAGFSWASLNAAIKGAKRLEKIEKEVPGALTRRQKDVLAEFNRLSGDVAVQGFIQNVRLKEALAETITTALQQNPFLTGLLGNKKQTHKVFEKYIKLRWEKQLLQKAVDEGARTSSLNKAKRKIEKLEKKLYSQLKKAQPGHAARINFKKLKRALNNASQMYETQANKILEELRDQIIESIETGKLKLQKEALPIIPL